MARLSCPSCRLRFTAAVSAAISTCPTCGRHLETVLSAADTLGLSLFTLDDPQPELPMAIEAAQPIDEPRPDRT
jgi:hypothetical protein